MDESAAVAQEGDESIDDHLLHGDFWVAVDEREMFENIEHAAHPLFDARRVPAAAAAEFGVDGWDTDLRRGLRQLPLGSFFIEDVADAEDSSQCQTGFVLRMVPRYADTDFVNHGVDPALVEVDAVVRLLDESVKEAVGDAFARRAFRFAREASVHLHLIDGTVGLLGVECVEIDDGHGDNAASQMLWGNFADNLVDNCDTVEFVAVAYRLEIERFIPVFSVDENDGKPHGRAVRQRADGDVVFDAFARFCGDGTYGEAVISYPHFIHNRVTIFWG